MFTDDVTFPRTRAGIGLLVRALAALAAGSTDDAMLDGCQYRNASSRRAQLSASRHLARRHEVDRWIKRIRSSSGSEWVCSSGQPYLTPVPDPADRAVAAPLNPRASWTVTFTSSDVRSAVLRCGGPDIGALQAVDFSNQVPPGVGHPISVRVFGSAANADLRADELLRTCLGLRSTMVRLTPF